MTMADRHLLKRCGDAIVRAAKAVAKPFRKNPMEEGPRVKTIWANGFRMDVGGDKLVFTAPSPISGNDIIVTVPKPRN